MHELALMDNLVTTIVAEAPPGRVVLVKLEIGELAAVVPASLYFCFDLCSRDTRVEGARLEIADVPAELKCEQCGRILRSSGSGLGGLLGSGCVCGSFALTVLRGEELRLLGIELGEEPVCAEPVDATPSR